MRILSILLVCPFMTGCLAYAYPSITQTPPITVNEPDVKAFRVTANGKSFGSVPYPTGTCSVAEIECANGQVASHRDAHLQYFILVFPVFAWNSHGDSVRLYRRGYETVTVGSEPWLISRWNNRHEHVVWKKAETLAAREKAIREIYGPNTFMFVTNRDKNAFIVAEFLELANSSLAVGVEHEETRERLRKTAKKITDGEPSGLLGD